ncbi:MAG TPA: TadE/TadG family type IV pilus assembly protein [Thermomicrobiales bacterium]|nr:TadE/TadG family type IV pilus assembly protein [Thermomicrobiales bacterium]
MLGDHPDYDATHMPSPRRDSGAAPRGAGSARGRSGRRATRGQALVELALIAPVLVLMLAISADFGRALTAYITVSSAAREGAAFGMMSAANATNTSGIRDAALADAPMIWGTAPTVSPSTDIDDNGYTRVTVTVSYTFTPFLSIPPIPNSLNMTRTVQMRVIS